MRFVYLNYRNYGFELCSGSRIRVNCRGTMSEYNKLTWIEHITNLRIRRPTSTTIKQQFRISRSKSQGTLPLNRANILLNWPPLPSFTLRLIFYFVLILWWLLAIYSYFGFKLSSTLLNKWPLPSICCKSARRPNPFIPNWRKLINKLKSRSCQRKKTK